LDDIEQQLMAREGLLDAGREFIFHVGGDSDDSSDDSSDSSGDDEEGLACGDDSDDSSDDSSDSSGGDEEGQACGDDIYADIAGVAPLE
jgi:hypothetical protein